MNKIITITLGVVAVFMLLIAIIMPLKNGDNTENYKQSGKTVSVIEKVYVVKAYHGKVAVFDENTDKPFKITDTDVKILPKQDKELLNKGIRANGLTELSKVLEDFCS